jgi:phage portal protein BeeE
MLLGIPGDNTYANYQEANRAFWRQTVLPLVARTAQSLRNWLGEAYGGELRLGYDADQVEALSSERDGLWARVQAATFLDDDEKRAAVGYGSADPAARSAGDGR